MYFNTESEPKVVCRTGTYIGCREKETGVYTFKGIPYAYPINQQLRWKAPVPLKPSNRTMLTKEFGCVCPQPFELSWQRLDEDCLTLNIWTKNLSTKNKTVMVYIHGGSYALGGSIVPEYNGQYLANKFEDIIVVTINYRINLFGFIDFSNVPGGEYFPTSTYNGFLDCQMALRFIQENIEAFGGDPSNVTIFGESAGAGMVNLLMTTPTSTGLFRRVIAQSGSVALSFSKKKFHTTHQTEELLRITNSKTMKDLCRLSTSDLLYAMITQTNYKGFEDLTDLAGLNNMPLIGSGSILPENPYQALSCAPSTDVDFMIGTNSDEFRMWVEEQKKPILEENMKFYYQFVKNKYEELQPMLSDEMIQNCKTALSIADVEYDSFARKYPNIWNYTDVANEVFFRIPAIKAAEAHLSGHSKTYMYYFKKRSTRFPWVGACHAAEIPYVLYNLHDNRLCGEVDTTLAYKMAASWVNFAKYGDPSSQLVDWDTYDCENRNTMVIENSCEMHMVKDPRKRQRLLLKDSPSLF